MIIPIVSFQAGWTPGSNTGGFSFSLANSQTVNFSVDSAGEFAAVMAMLSRHGVAWNAQTNSVVLGQTPVGP